jgi:hypothetical protein
MSEEIKQEKEVKDVEMYSYISNGKTLWTSNLEFAQLRARFYGTYDVYVEKNDVKDLNN